MITTRAVPRDSRPVAAARTAVPPIWRESLWPLEWLSLRMSPVYYGLGIPRGRGQPVVLVPGFLGLDAYLYEMYFWLARIGYRPHMSGIGVNADCPGVLTSRLTRTVESVVKESGRPVRIVGHSLGGTIGRRVALQRPDLVSHLVFLGSPLQAVHAHPSVVATASVLHAGLSLLSGSHGQCLTDRCQCGFTRDAGMPIPESIEHTAIYTRSDGVVDWHDAQETDPLLNHEVTGTHVGLVVNPAVYRILAGLLAAPAR